MKRNADIGFFANPSRREDFMRKCGIAFMVAVLSVALPTIGMADGLIEAQRNLKYEDVRVGDGKRATLGMIARIHLKAWMDDNKKKGALLFDSYADNFPLSFKIGTKRIVDGLNLGIDGMRVGGKRRLFLPPELSPKRASGEFPANTALIFEVELLELE
jgi:FKBP-type peptidyl-prolyl cis-trans isomerase